MREKPPLSELAEATALREVLGETDDIVDIYLKHYGKKGMKWGVINEDKPTGRKPGKAEDISLKSNAAKNSDPKSSNAKTAKMAEAEAKYKAVPKTEPKSAKEASKAFAENQNKHLAKAGFDEASGWRPTPKQVVAIAGTAAVIGLMVYGHQANKKGSSLFGDTQELLDSLKPGEPCSLEAFNTGVMDSMKNSWFGNDYIQRVSYDRPEFTLSAGHTFNRLSRAPETDFKIATYATHSTEDLNRYVANFRHELGGVDLHHITFKATEDIKVPNLVTSLETMREVLGTEDHGKALYEYHALSGGRWDNELAQKFFAALKDKGYGAIVDEMDAGVIGESPIVIFAKEYLSPKESKPLTAEAIKIAESSLTAIANRK